MLFKKTNTNSKRPALSSGQSEFLIEQLEDRQLLSASISFAYGASFGTSNAVESGNELVVDVDGNAISVGMFTDTVQIQAGFPETLTSVGGFDAYIAKTNENGDNIWAKRIGGTLDDTATSIAMDSVGDMYVVGTFEGRIRFDPSDGLADLVSNGGRDAFILKIDEAGDFLSAVSFGGTGDDLITSAQVNSLDSLVITGNFRGTVDFDPDAATFELTSNGQQDFFIGEFDDTGAFVWAANFGGTSADIANDLFVDANDDLFVTGRFSGTADFGAGAVTSNGGTDAFIASFDSTGTPIWSKTVGGVGDDEGQGVAIDSLDNPYIVGQFNDTVDFNPNVGVFTQSARAADGFLLKLDDAGNFVWVRRLGGTGDDLNIDGDVAVDRFDNIYVVGGNVSADGALVANQIRRFAADGSDQFSRQFDAKLRVSPTAIFVEQLTGNVFTTGQMNPGADLAPGPGKSIIPSGNALDDTFVSKLVPDTVINLASGNGNDEIIIRLNDTEIEVVNAFNDNVILSKPLAEKGGLVIFGSDTENDVVTVDFNAGGFFRLPGGIRFVGGDGPGSDQLFIKADGTLSGVSPSLDPLLNPLPGGSGEFVFGSNPREDTPVVGEEVELNELIGLEKFTIGGSVNRDSYTVAPITSVENGSPGMLVTGTMKNTQVRPIRLNSVASLRIETGAGNDRVVFVDGAATSTGLTEIEIVTGTENDQVILRENSLANTLNRVFVSLGAGNDRFTSRLTSFEVAAGGNFSVNGFTGTDSIESVADVERMRLGSSLLESSEGGVINYVQFEKATLTGGEGDNDLDASGFNGPVTLKGLDGDDILRGGDFNDLLRGFGGSDRLIGRGGQDRLFGDAGQDILIGGNGSDYLSGGAANDVLNGGAQNDTLLGNSGSDLFEFSGTNNDDILRVVRTSLSEAVIFRSAPGSSTRLDEDKVRTDQEDEFSLFGNSGDDRFIVAGDIKNVGRIDGGNGTDVCDAPADWLLFNC